MVSDKSGASSPGRIFIAVDVGGTFTDVVAITQSGRAVITKVPSESASTDPADAIVSGLLQHLDRLNAAAGDLHSIVHATTVATNTVLERRGERTAMVATEGFRDYTEIGEELIYELYNPLISFPPPLIPRGDRIGFSERTLADGSIETPIDPGRARELAKRLKETGCRSIAICFLHSHKNPENERQLERLLVEAMPDVSISLSSTVLPEAGEYARFSTTSIDAYVKPPVKRYLTRLQNLFESHEVNAPLSIMLSNGGNCDWTVSLERPSLMVESGPAAGVMAITHLQKTGRVAAKALAFDMGGTTAKISFLNAGQPLLTRGLEIGRESRFKPGSGLLLALPSVDVLEIGAGGGSIASIDSAGLLQVGPQSAGSNPGPACYGFGGQLPTVTDANLLLGYLVPRMFAGGSIHLDEQAARNAFLRNLSSLIPDPVEAAAAVHRVVVSNMALAARVAAAERGLDARSFDLVAFGGAGPMHAAGVARLLGIQRVVIPQGAGVMSSFGCLTAPKLHELIRGCGKTLAAIDWKETSRLLGEARAECVAMLRQSIGQSGVLQEIVQAEMRYKGQRRNRLYVDVPSAALEKLARGESIAGELGSTFERAYVEQYGRMVPGGKPEVIIWRVQAVSPGVVSDFKLEPPAENQRIDSKARMLFLDDATDSGWLLSRDLLAAKGRIAGPGVIVDADCTTVVPPDFVATIDDFGAIILTGQGRRT